MSRSKVKVTDDKKRKSAAFYALFGSRQLERLLCSARRVRGYAGGKISACCLVVTIFDLNTFRK